MLDIHTHILPGVDDGATDDAMAIEMLKAARQAGIDKIVATPHVRKSRNCERYRPAYHRLFGLAKEHRIQLSLGCELSVSALAGCATLKESLSPLKIGETCFLLLEFPDDAPSVDWEYLLSDIKRSGYHVIIAHPERYRYIAKDFAMAQNLLNYGCELQLNAQSFLNGRFSTERRAAVKLLESGSVSYIASDAHRPKDYAGFLAARRHLGKDWPSDGLLEKLI